MSGEALARRFHEAYERLAPQYGYETRDDTKAFDPDSANGRLVIAVCAELTTQQDSVDVERLRAALHEIATLRPIGGQCHVNSCCSTMEGIAARALSLPITQRDEQGGNDAAEIAAVVEAWRDAKRLGLRVLTFGMWKPAAIRGLSIEQGDQDGGGPTP